MTGTDLAHPHVNTDPHSSFNSVYGSYFDADSNATFNSIYGSHFDNDSFNSVYGSYFKDGLDDNHDNKNGENDGPQLNLAALINRHPGVLPCVVRTLSSYRIDLQLMSFLRFPNKIPIVPWERI